MRRQALRLVVTIYDDVEVNVFMEEFLDQEKKKRSEPMASTVRSSAIGFGSAIARGDKADDHVGVRRAKSQMDVMKALATEEAKAVDHHRSGTGRQAFRTTWSKLVSGW